MGTVTLAARVFVAVIFAVAAVTKLRHPGDASATFREFGVGERASRLAVLLAPSELIVAIGLMIVPTARWAGVAAMLLLLIFVAGIINALRTGRRPDCGCFGGFRAEPIGRSTLIRNALLLVISGVIAVRGPGPAVDDWFANHGAAAIVLSAMGVLAALAITLGVSSELDTIPDPTSQQAQPPPAVVVGQSAPVFSLKDASGESRSLASIAAPTQPLVLLFGNSGCGSCGIVLSQLAGWEATLAERVRFAVISGRDVEQALAVSSRYGVEQVLVDESGEVQRAYGVRLTPTAFAITPDGRIANGPAVGPDAVEELIRLTLRRLEPMVDPWSRKTQVA